MQTKFMMSDTTCQVVKLNEETALDKLPPMVYAVQHNQFVGFYLDIVKTRLELPKKIYGKTHERVEKCLKTYTERHQSTGILMTGDKGTGKTLLMSLLANAVIDQLGLPVILIKTPFHGSQFTSFIEDIGECALVFDEFGKMYSSNGKNENEVPQKSLLSLMDGVDKTKRLFILTENSQLDINEFMLNRPSRVYYHFKYKKLDEDSIHGYCEDRNVSKGPTQDIIDLSRRSRIFSFDMLQSIVEEHLRFGASIEEVTADLNIDLREEKGTTIEVIKIIDKENGIERKVYGSSLIEKPSQYSYIKLHRIEMEVSENDKEPDDDDDYDEFYIDDSDLAYEHAGRMVYETDGFTVVAKEIPTIAGNYHHLLA